MFLPRDVPLSHGLEFAALLGAQNTTSWKIAALLGAQSTTTLEIAALLGAWIAKNPGNCSTFSLEIKRFIYVARVHIQNLWTAHPYIRKFSGNKNM